MNKYPSIKDYKTSDAHLEALKSHFNYIEGEENRIKRMKNSNDFLNDETDIVHVEGDKSKLSVMYTNLVSYANHLGKQIIKICRQEKDGKLIYYAKLGE